MPETATSRADTLLHGSSIRRVGGQLSINAGPGAAAGCASHVRRSSLPGSGGWVLEMFRLRMKNMSNPPKIPNGAMK
jgi:hypothetical protein